MQFTIEKKKNTHLTNYYIILNENNTLGNVLLLVIVYTRFFMALIKITL
jgi:hypothetical protein